MTLAITVIVTMTTTSPALSFVCISQGPGESLYIGLLLKLSEDDILPHTAFHKETAIFSPDLRKSNLQALEG